MGKVVLHLVVCCLVVTHFLSSSVTGCGRSKPSDCTDSECDKGTCVQINDFIIRECDLKLELRNLQAAFFRRLYRVLRVDENPAFGLFAKDAGASKSVQSHVGCGSRPNYRSQWISTTVSLEAAHDFAYLQTRNSATTVQYRITEINRDCLQNRGIRMVDLTYASTEQLPGVLARNFARRYSEVLVEGEIPASCIEATQSYSSRTGNDRC